MFKRILIANRGEIAVRIIRCCREMGIETVAIYSTVDKDALHVQLANISVCVGGPKARDSYLHMQNILSAAMATGCEGIHPGFGFLSENPEFARLATECGLQFIGPTSETIEKIGNKAAARRLMIKHQVPVVPGSEGNVETVLEAIEVAEKVGYPVLIKASAGGGGRGMRRAYVREEIEQAFSTAKAEAMACFGNDEMYIEKLIINPKHIEFQILADNFGNVIHLGERDCSVQRKNQKLMEEAPSKALTPELREKMGAIAVKAAKAANYVNAGTIEYVLDKKGNFYFIEMNTRIQVEHPVTEMVTGVDLIKEQLRIASNLALSVTQEQVSLKGHAIECRINAEDPKNNFAPSAGKIEMINMPGGFGVRIDTAIFQGSEVSPYYDSMIAKVIVHGNTRLEAIRRMRRVLEEFLIQGVTTNLGLEYAILHNAEYLSGNYDTSFIEKNLEDILEVSVEM